MTNSFKTLEQAEKSWKTDKAWELCRNFFTKPLEVAICKEVVKKKVRYFIITDRDCVVYRHELKQVVKFINATYLPLYKLN